MQKQKISRQVIILGFVSFFTDIASEMLYPVTPIFLTAALGASMTLVGVLEGTTTIVAGLLKGYFGALSDSIQKRAMFVRLGYSLSALVKPLPGFFPTIGTVISARISDRIGKGIRTAPRDALLASHATNNTGSVFGLHRTMDTLGAAAGPLLALLILSYNPMDYPMVYTVAVIPSLLAIGFTFAVKDKFVERRKKNTGKLIQFWRQAPVSYKYVFVLISIFSLVNSSDVFLILKSKEISGSDTTAIFGYVFFNIVYAIASYPLGILSDKIGKKIILSSGLIVFSVVYLGFAMFSDLTMIFVLFTFYGLYAAATEGVTKAWISDMIPDAERGSAIGLLTMVSSIMVMLGSMGAGFLWDMFGSEVPFIISSVVSTIIAFFLFFGKRA